MTLPSAPLTGSIVALITPLHEDTSVDYAALRKLIDWHIADGTDCFAVVGHTREWPTVCVQEHCANMRATGHQRARRVPRRA